jgi:hypothetical protein
MLALGILIVFHRVAGFGMRLIRRGA